MMIVCGDNRDASADSLMCVTRGYMSGSSRCVNLLHVVSLHHSFMLSIRSQSVSSSSPYISYFPPSRGRPPRRATSMAALFSPLYQSNILSQRAMPKSYSTHLRRSRSSCRSGKNSRGSKAARTASAARNKNESPSSIITSHNLAHASNGKWSRNSGINHLGRYAAGDIWCCLKLK